MSELITKKPLYTKIDISKMSKIDILDILFYKKPIDSFCPYCNNVSIFIKVPNREFGTLESKLREYSFLPDLQKKLFNEPEIFQLDFSCSRNKNHLFNVIYKVENETIIKIGQSPSLFDIQKNDLKKYRNILGSSYTDLSKAVMLFTSGFGVAAFTHIRRIIENFFVKRAYEIKKEEPDWDDKEYRGSEFLKKLKALKDLLPETLMNNPKLYSIVSKGIHQLEEDECLLVFEAIKKCVLLSLDDIIKEEKDRKDRKKIKSELSRIENRINNK